MRVSIELVTYGTTIEEVIEAATNEWRRVTNDSSAELPEGCEIVMSAIDGADYKTYRSSVYIKTKKES